jgi:uncharacterized YccA/Bax inhibitor family protein
MLGLERPQKGIAMALMKTSNPVLNGQVFRGVGYVDQMMTISGTVNKTGILMLCVLATAAWTWSRFMSTGDPAAVAPLLLLGVFGGLIFSLVTVFKKEWSAVTAPIYALCEGLFLGGISALFEMRFPGIAMQAVGLTFGTLIALLLVYRTGIIRVTDKFVMGVAAATGGIAVFYLLSMLLGFFGVHFNSVFGSGPIGIVFSVVVVIVAALNLILDFAFIENGAQAGAPKYMEWYGAFGLMVTLIWLYLEILRLLAKLNSRNR